MADSIMGNIVTVRHSNNLVTVYQSLNEVNFIVGDVVKQGDVMIPVVQIKSKPTVKICYYLK